MLEGRHLYKREVAKIWRHTLDILGVYEHQTSSSFLGQPIVGRRGDEWTVRSVIES